MGVTISHRLSLQRVNVKATLDRTQKIAEQVKKEQADKLEIPFNIRRTSDTQLLIDIGNCETLSLTFKSVADIKADAQRGWSYLHATLTEDGKKELYEGYEIAKYPQNEIYYASAFCKTQFARSLLEHKWVAELIRSVASYCLTAEINDEGDYYHTGDINDASDAIEQNGKLIDSIGIMLTGKGWEGTQVIKGGETTIKSRRNKKAK